MFVADGLVKTCIRHCMTCCKKRKKNGTGESTMLFEGGKIVGGSRRQAFLGQGSEGMG